jgi:hypothetical protein
MFNLQAEHLSNNHKIKPIDYWASPKESKKLIRPFGNEYEDRVLSHKPTIDIPEDSSKLIHSIHVLHSPNYDFPHNTRKLLLKAKTMGIPISLYNNRKDWGKTKIQLKDCKVKIW